MTQTMSPPQYIQSRDTGKVYVYEYTLVNGMYSYADSDNFYIVIPDSDIPEKFYDVTELENRLRDALREANVVKPTALCEYFVACTNKATIGIPTMFGVIPCCERCRDVVAGKSADTKCQHVALCESDEECQKKGAE